MVMSQSPAAQCASCSVNVEGNRLSLATSQPTDNEGSQVICNDLDSPNDLGAITNTYTNPKDEEESSAGKTASWQGWAELENDPVSDSG